MRTHSFHRQNPTGRQDWFYFRCRHGKDRRGNLADSWRQSLIDIIDEPSPRPRQLLQPHQPSPGVHPAIFYSPAHLHRSLQLPAHRRPFGLPKNFAAQLFVKLHAGHTRCFAVGHAGDGRGDGGCGAASGAAGAAGQSHSVQRGHRAHICRGCFRRPASSPAAEPEPA